MNVPDPERLGGLGWVRRTGGQLSRGERRRLVAAIALGQWENAVGRAKLALGRLPAAAKRVNHTLRIGSLGGATMDNEWNYVQCKLMRALGVVQIENQARI